MLYWALVFLLVSLVAALFGFGVLFFVFIVLFLLSLVFGLMRRRRP
jgi:uncharacterized membrane protein YtjA (UPF0391 family)